MVIDWDIIMGISWESWALMMFFFLNGIHRKSDMNGI